MGEIDENSIISAATEIEIPMASSDTEIEIPPLDIEPNGIAG